MVKRVPGHVKSALSRQAVKGDIRPPDLAKLVAHFFDAAGGERAVARLLFEEYLAAPAGGVVRQRILDMIMRGVKYVNEKVAPTDDLGLLSDEDLERELDALVEVVEGVSDGQEKTQAPGQPAARPDGEGEAGPRPAPPERDPGADPG